MLLFCPFVVPNTTGLHVPLHELQRIAGSGETSLLACGNYLYAFDHGSTMAEAGVVNGFGGDAIESNRVVDVRGDHRHAEIGSNGAQVFAVAAARLPAERSKCASM